MTVNVASLAPMLTLSPRAGDSKSGDHFVELYDDDASLVDSLARFTSVGLADGEAVIVAADRAHRTALHDALTGLGVDVPTVRAQGLFQSLDALDTLALFMDDGQPDPEAFENFLREMITRASAGGRRVRIFGEMVSLLWAEGNVGAALRLEDLWNRLAESHAFRLFCAYPTTSFSGKNLAPLRAVCHRHTHLVATRETTI
jgi:DcmR-like sensory protein